MTDPSISSYLAQLRILAASYSSFATDLKRQMVRSAFLLASKHVTHTASNHKPPLGDSSKANLEREDEDLGAILEFDLAAAKDVCKGILWRIMIFLTDVLGR